MTKINRVMREAASSEEKTLYQHEFTFMVLADKKLPEKKLQKHLLKEAGIFLSEEGFTFLTKIEEPTTEVQTGPSAASTCVEVFNASPSHFDMDEDGMILDYDPGSDVVTEDLLEDEQELDFDNDGNSDFLFDDDDSEDDEEPY